MPMQHQDDLTILQALLGNVQAEAGRQAMLREPQIIQHGRTLLWGERPGNGGLIVQLSTDLDDSA